MAALITRVLGAARPCRRAARLGVSPRANCSCRRAAPHVAHHHEPGMDPQAHGQVHPPLLRQAGIELPQGLHHPQPGPHRPLGIIFVRQGVAEVDEQAIAEILGDMPLKAGDHLGAGVLIGPHHLAQVFRVELAGEHRRVHQVTEQHGELAAFGVRRRWMWLVRPRPEQERLPAWPAEVRAGEEDGGEEEERSAFPVQIRMRPCSSLASCWASMSSSLRASSLLIQVELDLQCPVCHALPLTRSKQPPDRGWRKSPSGPSYTVREDACLSTAHNLKRGRPRGPYNTDSWEGKMREMRRSCDLRPNGLTLSYPELPGQVAKTMPSLSDVALP